MIPMLPKIIIHLSKKRSELSNMASHFLMLPENDHLSLYSLKEKKPRRHKILQTVKDLRCVGSCRGWLAFLDEKGNPFLLNPFSAARLHLPPTHTLPVRDKNSAVVKVALSSRAVVVMYSLGLRTKIAFCKKGGYEWRGLDCKCKTYYDVFCCDERDTIMLFALAPGPSVESWDLKQTDPKPTVMIQDSCPRTLQLARKTFPAELYSTQWYLAVSPLRQIFLIVRYIGEFVRYDGKVVCEGDTLTDYAAEPLVCPYKTVDFRVLRLDGDGREWVDVECLNDFSVFLGGNQAAMVKRDGLKRNAIYFTDDYWERIDEDYSYGGHDLGVFSMEDGSIEPLLDGLQQKIQPPPVWIITDRS